MPFSEGDGQVADLQAFKGLRYDLAKVGSLDQVVAPPYDVIDSCLQKWLYDASDYNVVRLILNRAEPNDDGNERYKRAADILRRWRKETILVEENLPSLYVYHQTFDLDGTQVTRKGFMGRIRLEKLGVGNIYPHEETHSAAKADRFKLMSATHCNLSPVFSLYPDSDNVIQTVLDTAVSGTPPLSCVDHLGVRHEMWPLKDNEAISSVVSKFGPLPLFIADGHHRYETALNILESLKSSQEVNDDHPANYTLMMCVGMSDPGLSVLPTHRLFRGIPEQGSAELLEKIKVYFDSDVEGQGIQDGRHIWETIHEVNDQGTIGLYCPKDSNWLLASLNEAGSKRLEALMPGKSEALRSLGVSILHELLIGDCFPEANKVAPKYVRSVEELIEGIEVGDQAGRDATGQAGSDRPFGLAAIVLPASVGDVRQICTAGERMPAKSTYFYPKMLSGLVINQIQ